MSSEAIKVALAGFGTVGQALLQLMNQQQQRHRRILGRPLLITALFDRSFQRKKDLYSPEIAASSSIQDFLTQPADIFVELVGGLETAEEIVEGALRRGKAVVTANKALVARRGPELLRLAEAHQSSLAFEASVAGGIPILRTLQSSLFADEIQEIRGILNGTCNFILSDMASRRKPFEIALAKAQSLGYAEADPSLDISGQDAAEKLTILSALAFSIWPQLGTFQVTGITELQPIDFRYAEQLGGVWRLLGLAKRRDTSLSLMISPFLVDRSLALASVSGANNAIELCARHLGSLFVAGPGAGGQPTAAAVAADVLNAALSLPQPLSSAPVTLQRAGAPVDEQYPFYIRFTVKDEPGIIAQVASILAQEGINIDSVYQQRWSEREQLPFVITTDPAPWSRMNQALDHLEGLPFNRLKPLRLPILRANS